MSNTDPKPKLNIDQQLLEVQKEINAVKKNSDNPYFKSKYADLNALMQEAKPVLNEHDLYVRWEGRYVEGQYNIVTVIKNTDGEYVECPVPVLLSKQNDSQAQGSSITYGRRYGLQSLLGMETEDDDGNLASNKITPKEAKPAPTLEYTDDEIPFDEYDDFGFTNSIESGETKLVDKYGKDNFFGHPYIGKCTVSGCEGLMYKNDNGWKSCNNYKSHPKKS